MWFASSKKQFDSRGFPVELTQKPYEKLLKEIPYFSHEFLENKASVDVGIRKMNISQGLHIKCHLRDLFWVSSTIVLSVAFQLLICWFAMYSLS